MQCQWLHVPLLLYILKVAFKKWVSLHNGLQQSDVSQVLNWDFLFLLLFLGFGGFFVQLDTVFLISIKSFRRYILMFTYMLLLKQDSYSLYSLVAVLGYF